MVGLSPWAKGFGLLTRHLGFGVIGGVCLELPEDCISEGPSNMEDLEQGKDFFVVVDSELFVFFFFVVAVFVVS